MLSESGIEPGGRKTLSLLHTRTEWLLSPASMLYQGYCVSYPGLNQPGRGVEHPSHSSAEVKNAEGHTSTFPLCLRWHVTG